MKKETRVAHSEGFTDIVIHKDGSIVTVGNDADVRIWNGYSDDDPVSFSATDSCFGIIVTDRNEVIVSTENNTVEAYEYPKGKFLGNKMKFTGAVNHVDASKDGRVVVAGSADTTIQVIVGEGTLPKKITAHAGPVLAVAIDPQVVLFASSGCDGNVCVWSIENPMEPTYKWFEQFTSSSDIALSSTLCRMAWHPIEGKYLAVPSGNKIMLYGRDTWNCFKSLTCSKITKDFSIVRFSPCGLYLAGGGSDGTIVIWDSAAFIVKIQIKEGYHITGMAFNSTSEELLCTDFNGQLISVRDFLNAGANTSSASATESTNQKAKASSPSQDELDENDVFGDGIDYAFVDDEDDENAFSITKIKADVGFVGDEYVGPSKAKQAEKVGELDDDDDAKSVNSLASSKIIKNIGLPVGFNPFTVPQKPFQPSSTPEHLTHRFMAWNNVGIIRSYSSEMDDYNDEAIDIEFHDATFHQAIHLRNQHDYTIGNVSNEVVTLACGKSSDSPSKLFCLNFKAWDSHKDWTVDMPKNEEATGIALGTGWIAVATSENRIRLFSVSGVQKFVYDTPGTVICLAGFENLLFIAYHNSFGINGNQSVSYLLLKLNKTSTRLSPLLMDLPLPITKQASLSWIGFTDEGTPVYSDTKDVLRILNGRLWSPFCDMKTTLHSPNDHYWVVGASETASHVRAVKCKGNKYPLTLPRPTIMMLDAQIPLCELETEKTELENNLLTALFMDSAVKKMERKSYDVDEYKDKAAESMKEALFKLFVLSTKSNRDHRACEYAEMMPTAHAVQIAVKFASKSMKRALTERLQTIGHIKMQEGENDLQEIDDFELSNIITHTEHRTVTAAYESDRSFNDSLTSTPQPNGQSRLSISIEDNPLLRKQKDEIRSLLSSASLKKNPFKKDAPSNNSSLTRHTSFTGSLMKSSSSLDSNVSQDPEESTVSDKGMAKIDVWKKPVEKAVSLPEFNPKDPRRKSAAAKSNDKQPVAKKPNPFEKKGKEKENSASSAKSQRKLFDMAGLKGKDDKKRCGSSNPASPATHDDSSQDLSLMTDPEGEGETQFFENALDSASLVSDVADKKRKRSGEPSGDLEKKTKLSL